MGTIELPIVDQPGWVDEAQNGYTSWTYKIIEAVQGVAQKPRQVLLSRPGAGGD